jgi:hypothetical protein
MKRKEIVPTSGRKKKIITIIIATLAFATVMQLVKPKEEAKDAIKAKLDLLNDTSRINGKPFPYTLQALKPDNESPERQRQRGLIMDSIRAILKDINDSNSTNNSKGGKRP